MASGSNVGSASSLSSNQSTFGQSSSTASSNWSNLSQSPSYGSSYSSQKLPPKYIPSPKHEKGGSGTPNPIKTKEEGQKLLETGYKEPGGKQIYNITESGKAVKFQPDNTPLNGYHSYEISDLKDIPTVVLRQMFEAGKIRKVKYNKLIKNKWK